MKKEVFSLLVAMVFLFFLPSLSAIGISPSSMDIAFEPNLHKEFTLNLVNSGERPLNATFQLGGDLAPYFKLDEGFFVIPPQSVRAYHIVMNLPREIKRPGRHIVSVNAVQGLFNTGKETKGIGALVSVQGEIVVQVPYPGKYAEVELEIIDINEKETSTATINVINYGLDDIRYATATLTLFNNDGTPLDTLQSSTLSIPSRQSDYFTLLIDSTEYGPGIYPVTAFVDYDSLRTDSISRELRIGTLYANITNHTKEIFAGKITLFEVHLQNRWNNKLENVYVGLTFFKEGIPLQQVLRTPSLEIQPWQEATASAFFDATTLEQGAYEVEITAYYHGKTTVLRSPLTIKKPVTFSLTMVLVAVIFLMLLIDLILWIIHKRNRDD